MRGEGEAEKKRQGDNECVEEKRKTLGMSTGGVCGALLQPYNKLCWQVRLPTMEI